MGYLKLNGLKTQIPHTTLDLPRPLLIFIPRITYISKNTPTPETQEVCMTSLIRILAAPLRFATAVLVFAIVLVTEGAIPPAQESPAFTVLYSFNSGHGAFPFALLTTPSGVLYGTATGGGCANCSGLVFKLVLSSTNTAY